MHFNKIAYNKTPITMEPSNNLCMKLDEEAKNSPLNNQMAALIMRNGKILASGHNMAESPRRSILQSHKCHVNDYTLHAEIATLMNLLRFHPSYYERRKGVQKQPYNHCGPY
jgi:deoxycytidylate deaminase